MKSNTTIPGMGVQLFIRNNYRALFNLFIVSLIYIFWIGFAYNSINNMQAFLRIFLYASIYVAVVLFNIYILLDRYFLKGETTTYLVTSITSFLFASLLLQRIYSPSWQAYFQSIPTSDFVIEMIILGIKFVTFTSVGIAYRLLELWILGEQKISALTNAHLATELENLKKQVSPHFLFNTLNNLYVLAKVNPPLAADTILELSDMLKYQLYDCSNERVPLKREIIYIKQLLALEQLRKDKWSVTVDVKGEIPDNIHIAPLLLIILVENSVKHGMYRAETGYIFIHCAISDGKLIFRIINTIRGTENQADTSKRIGLRNLKRRLELIYPQKHELNIKKGDTIFTAELILPV